MATLTIGTPCELPAALLTSMLEFRRDVFVGRLGWSLPMIDGMERDQYDRDAAMYFVIKNEEQRVTACARLLPTTDSYMLPDLFPQLLGSHPAPRDPTIWELSRFATSVRETHEGRVLSLSKPTLDLLDAVFRFARAQGVERLAMVTSIGIERLILRAGISAHRIASPSPVCDGLCVALFIEVPAAQAAQIAPMPLPELHRNRALQFAAG